MTLQADTTTADSTRAWVYEDGKDFLIRSKAYADPALFEREMEYVFSRTWVYVGHVSELSQSGDYKATWLGRRPIILSRGRNGEIHAHINACRHRGMAVCRESAGNTSAFRCPYHGWTYGLDGHLLGVTDRKGYRADFAAQIDGLIKVPGVQTYRGLIFCNLVEDAQPLIEHLKYVRPYIDFWADTSIGEEHKLHPPHRFAYPGNWKMQPENSVDGYHPKFLHESAFRAMSYTYGEGGAGNGSQPRSVDRDFQKDNGASRGIPGGHGIAEKRPEDMDENVIGFTKLTKTSYDHYRDKLIQAYGARRADELGCNRHIMIFPNLILMDNNVRAVYPLTVDRTEVHSHFAEVQGVDAAVNQERLADLQARLGTTGLIAPDDQEVFGGNQTGLSAGLPEWFFLSRGLGLEHTSETGECVGSYSFETAMRSFWRQWANVIGEE